MTTKRIVFIYILLFNYTIYAQEQKEYYETGELSKIGTLIDGKKEGVWKSYHKNGKLYKIGSYKNDKKVGDWKYYHENGILKTTYQHTDGNIHKKRITYYDNGKVKYLYNEHSYKKYSKDGVLIEELKKNGSYKTYYSNGILKESGYVENKPYGIIKTGIWKGYNDNKVLEYEVPYVNDKKEGLQKTYHSNGSLQEVTYFKEGKKFGKLESYHEDGQLKCSGTYDKKSKTISTCTFYYENKQIKSKGNITQGYKDGFWKYYYQNGQLYKEGYYKMGTIIGDWTFYNEKGILQAKNNKNPTISLQAKSIKDFVPKQWKITQKVYGHLNNDELEDVVLVIENTAFENYFIKHPNTLGPEKLNTNERYLLVLFKNRNFYYDRMIYNKNFIPSEHDIGAPCLEDPLNEIKIENHTINLSFYYWFSCGTYGVIQNNYKFKYQNNRFELTEFLSDSYARNSGEIDILEVDYIKKSITYTSGGNMFDDNRDKPEVNTKPLKNFKIHDLQSFTFESFEY